jgi:hypothetical protein
MTTTLQISVHQEKDQLVAHLIRERDGERDEVRLESEAISQDAPQSYDAQATQKNRVRNFFDCLRDLALEGMYPEHKRPVFIPAHTEETKTWKP